MNRETQVFRSTKKYWLNWFIITIVAAFMLMLIERNLFRYIREATTISRLLFLGLFALLILASFAFNHKTTWPFPWKIKFTVSETAVSGFNGTTTFNTNWDDLIFLHYEKQKNTHWLFLATQEEDIHFSLDHLPATAVWQALAQKASHTILKDMGYQQVIGRDAAKANELVESIVLPLVVRPSQFFRWTFALGAVFFFGMAVMCWQQKLWGGIPFFLIPTLIAIYYLLQMGSVKFDECSIHYVMWKRHYQIHWENVTHLEADQQGSSIVFQGAQQQLVIPGFSVYHKQDRLLMANFLDFQLNQRQLLMHNNWKAMFRQQKNTKVKS